MRSKDEEVISYQLSVISYQLSERVRDERFADE